MIIEGGGLFGCGFCEICGSTIERKIPFIGKTKCINPECETRIRKENGMSGLIWKGKVVAEDVTDDDLFDERKTDDDRLFEVKCAGCGAKQLFKLSKNTLTLIQSEHVS